MTRLKVLLVGPTTPATAGPEVVTSILLKEGPQVGLKYIHVDTSNFDNRRKGSYSLGNIVHGFLQVWKFFYRAIVARVRGVRLVHIPLSQNTTGVIRDLTLMIIAKILRYKIVVHFHGGDFGNFYNDSKMKWIIRAVLCRADRLLVLGRSIVQQFSFMERHRLDVLPNPIPPSFVERKAMRRGMDKGSTLRILFVGHLSVSKGFVDLIQALTLLHKPVELHCIGQRIDKEKNIRLPGGMSGDYGWERAQQIISEHPQLRSWITFHGVLEGMDKVNLFDLCHVLCLPSYSEGMPMAIIEGMASGMMIIGSDVGAISDLVDKEFLIQPGDIGRLAKLIDATTEIDAGRIGQQNNLRVLQQCDPKSLSNRLMRIYETVNGSKWHG